MVRHLSAIAVARIKTASKCVTSEINQVLLHRRICIPNRITYDLAISHSLYQHRRKKPVSELPTNPTLCNRRSPQQIGRFTSIRRCQCGRRMLPTSMERFPTYRSPANLGLFNLGEERIRAHSVSAHASSNRHCVTALAVVLLASFIATAVFSPPFSVYLTVTLVPSFAPS